MASQATRDICAKHFGWLGAEPDPALDADEALAVMRQHYDEIAPSPPAEAAAEQGELGGVPGVWFTPPDAGDTVVIFLHGGGLVIGSSTSHGDLGARIALASGARTFVADYRRAPEFTFPAQIDDAVAMYHAVLADGTDPKKVVLIGDSAGLVNPFNGEGIAYAMESATLAADAVLQALGRGEGPAREAALAAYPVAVSAQLGRYYRLGNTFSKLIGQPKIMATATKLGLPRKRLMYLVLKLLAGLYDTRDGDWADRVVTALTKAVPSVR
jgi:hypothetical protein